MLFIVFKKNYDCIKNADNSQQIFLIDTLFTAFVSENLS